LLDIEIPATQREGTAAPARGLHVQSGQEAFQLGVVSGGGGDFDDPGELIVRKRSSGAGQAAWLRDRGGWVGGLGDEAVGDGLAVDTATVTAMIVYVRGSRWRSAVFACGGIASIAADVCLDHQDVAGTAHNRAEPATISSVEAVPSLVPIDIPGSSHGHHVPRSVDLHVADGAGLTA
jgi:hypothetical protein